jgi:hypothetical protein
LTIPDPDPVFFLPIPVPQHCILPFFQTEEEEETTSSSSGEPEKKKPMNLALGKLLTKEKKPISPFLRAKHGTVLGGEGGSGLLLNKHIRFNEKGEVDETVKDEDKETKTTINGNAAENDSEKAALQNGGVKNGSVPAAADDAETAVAAGKENGGVKNGAVPAAETAAAGKENGGLLVNGGGHEEGSSEKENRDLNGVDKGGRVRADLLVEDCHCFVDPGPVGFRNVLIIWSDVRFLNKSDLDPR